MTAEEARNEAVVRRHDMYPFRAMTVGRTKAAVCKTCGQRVVADGDIVIGGTAHLQPCDGRRN